MKYKIFFYIVIMVSGFGLMSNKAVAQNSDIDTIPAYAKIVGEDTFALFYLEDFLKNGSGKGNSDRALYWRKLRYNVYKVYPYAIKASGIVNEIDGNLSRMPDKRARKKYLKTKESELKKQFKSELKDLTTTQGSILVKLINRQTGKDVYSMIRELKGGFAAGVSQTTAYFFDNDLKSIYEPYGADQDIELIVREIETKGFFR